MTTTSPTPLLAAPTLSRLYAARFAFALLWGVTVLAFASEINPFVGALLVVYPVYDLVAIAADARRPGADTSRTALHVNLVVSAVAAIAVALAATSGTAAVLRVFGVWAVVAGIAQLAVAIGRRRVGGQLPIVTSGAISVLAGVAFVAQAAGDDPSLGAIGGYALLGGLFFLISSILLRRRQG